MFDFLYHWADAIWLPIVYFTVHKKHKWYALGLVVACMILIRLQAEMMVYIGYGNGIMGLMKSNVHTRGLAVSGFFYVLFLAIAHFSPRTQGVVFMAACLTIFFMLFCTVAIIMLL